MKTAKVSEILVTNYKENNIISQMTVMVSDNLLASFSRQLGPVSAHNI
jgi:hypothetical protein